MSEENNNQSWLERRPVQDTGVQYSQSSVDGRVLWMFNPTTGSHSMIDQRGMKHEYSPVDTQRLVRFLMPFVEDIDRAAAREMARFPDATTGGKAQT